MGKSPTKLKSVPVLLLLLALGIGSMAAEFKASMVEHDGDETKTSQITVKGSKYRLDVEENGEKLFVIVDQEKETTWIVVPSEKTYMEIASQSPQSLRNDPFQSVKYTLSAGELKPAGTETVNGYECDKSVISMLGEDVMTQYVSKKLGFPLKIEQHMQGNRYVELTDISEEPVDDTLFVIPEGFSKWVDPADLPVEIPEWAENLQSAPIMTPPFEKTLSAGDIIRVPVEFGKSVWAKVTDQSENAEARGIPFKDGRPVKNPQYYNNIAQKGLICSRHNETSHEADEIVFYVSEGNFTITTKYFDMFEKRVAPGDECRFPVMVDEHVEARFANGGDGQSVCLVSFYKDGQDISEAPENYRTIKLDKPKDYKTRSYDTEVGNEIVINTKMGVVVVKMGQYDAFEF